MLLWIQGGEDLRKRRGGHCGILTLVTDTTSGQAAFTMYTTTTCGPCVRLKQRLGDLGIAFDEVNVEEDEAAAAWVTSVNAGDRLVPTLRFADGSVLSNPPLELVLERIATLGGSAD